MNETEMKSFFRGVGIVKHHAGFGMFQAEPPNGDDYSDESDLEDTMRDGCGYDLHELGVDEVPEGAEDIRGRIYNEPHRVFVFVDQDGRPHYVGISETMR
jgi:hypothetical protein